MVGTESDIESLVKDLILLEHDAIAAYDSCIKRLDTTTFRNQIAQFKQDHLQHLSVLTGMANELRIEAPIEGDMKRIRQPARSRLLT